LLKAYKNKQQTIFIDKELMVGNYDPELETNIILSPYFYWIKKAKLPVKFEYQAKNLSESVYDGFLPEGDFSYKAQKTDEGEFILFAYEPKKIAQTLKELNINIKKIKRLYFAQNELEDMECCIQISEKKALALVGDTVQLVKSCNITEPISMWHYLRDKETFSKFAISPNEFFQDFIDLKTFYIINTLLFLMLLVGVGEYFIYHSSYKTIVQEEETIFSQYNLPQTSFERENILKKYTKIDKEQINIRRSILHMLKLRLRNDEHIKKIDFNKDMFEVQIKIKENKRAEVLKKELIEFFDIKEIRVKDLIMYVRGKITNE